MFLLALVYLIIVVVFGFFGYRRSGLETLPEFVLFLIIGIVLFWSVLNR
jgi:hypothetical protein